MKTSARLYHCARCHCQVIICRRCDRGQLYCADGCAQTARTSSLRRAGKKYQASRRGRMANAQRQQRYRTRQQKKVTHQGSPPTSSNDVLPTRQNRPQHDRLVGKPPVKTAIHCHFCGHECLYFLRRGFLLRHERAGSLRKTIKQKPKI